MNIRRFQGWALIISALVSTFVILFYLFGATGRIQYLYEALTLVATLLFIFGLPSIQSAQPQTKLWGQIGTILMLIPLIDLLLVEFLYLFVGQSVLLSKLEHSIWTSLAKAGVAYSGYLLVGWLTIRARVFPAWAGWLFLIYGAVMTVYWQLPNDVWSSTVPEFLFWTLRAIEIVALVGYGWGALDTNRYKYSISANL